MPLVYLPDIESLFLWGSDSAPRALPFLGQGGEPWSTTLLAPEGLREMDGLKLPLFETAANLSVVLAADLDDLPGSVADDMGLYAERYPAATRLGEADTQDIETVLGNIQAQPGSADVDAGGPSAAALSEEVGVAWVQLLRELASTFLRWFQDPNDAKNFSYKVQNYAEMQVAKNGAGRLGSAKPPETSVERKLLSMIEHAARRSLEAVEKKYASAASEAGAEEES